jgi:hypothetical protein
LEEQDVDEVFDMSVVNAINSDMMVHMGKDGVEEAVIERLIYLLNQVSVLHYSVAPGEKQIDGKILRTDPVNLTKQNDALSPLLSSPLALEIVTTPQQAGVLKQRKEKLAQLCLRSLFDFCARNGTLCESLPLSV